MEIPVNLKWDGVVTLQPVIGRKVTVATIRCKFDKFWGKLTRIFVQTGFVKSVLSLGHF